MISNERVSPAKLLSLEDAVEVIKSGDSIWIGSTHSIPSQFLDILADRHKELHDVTLLGNNFINYSKLLVDTKYTDTFHIISFFESSQFISPLSNTSNVEYIKKPSRPYSKTLVDKFNINVMVVEVCPPDENGNCNVGVSGRAITPYLNKCDGIIKKIAVINKLQRPTVDDGELISIPLSDFDYISICNH